MTFNTEASAFSALVQAVDTVYYVQSRDAWDLAVGASVVIVGLTALGALVFLGFLLVQLRKTARRVEKLKRDVAADPGVQRLRNVADHLDYITHSLRSDVDTVSRSVTRLSQRVENVSDRLEDRIEDFNALLEVLQGEAEEVFLDTASAVRGVKAGTRRARRDRRDRRDGDTPTMRDGPPLDVHPDDAELGDDA